MTYCKQTDGNLAALAQYQAEQNQLYAIDNEINEKTEELMGDIKCDHESIAWEAITESEDAANALCEIVKNYTSNPNVSLKSSVHNHKLVCDFINAVEQYCRESVEASL
jgi:hypothetical protein